MHGIIHSSAHRRLNDPRGRHRGLPEREPTIVRWDLTLLQDPQTG
jgi:hypothetical protein